MTTIIRQLEALDAPERPDAIAMFTAQDAADKTALSAIDTMLSQCLDGRAKDSQFQLLTQKKNEIFVRQILRADNISHLRHCVHLYFYHVAAFFSYKNSSISF
jgi:hypothetical protein